MCQKPFCQLCHTNSIHPPFLKVSAGVHQREQTNGIMVRNTSILCWLSEAVRHEKCGACGFQCFLTFVWTRQLPNCADCQPLEHTHPRAALLSCQIDILNERQIHSIPDFLPLLHRRHHSNLD